MSYIQNNLQMCIRDSSASLLADMMIGKYVDHIISRLNGQTFREKAEEEIIIRSLFACLLYTSLRYICKPTRVGEFRKDTVLVGCRNYFIYHFRDVF